MARENILSLVWSIPSRRVGTRLSQWTVSRNQSDTARFNAEDIIRNLISPAYYSVNMEDKSNSLPQHRLMIPYAISIHHLADQIIEELPE